MSYCYSVNVELSCFVGWRGCNVTNTRIFSKVQTVETDPIGNKQYDKRQYQIKGNEIYQTGSVGNIQYQKIK